MRKILALAALATVAATPVSAQTIISATSAVVNSGGPGSGSIVDTYNQSGLSVGYTSGVTNFNTYIAGNPRHSVIFSGFEWFSNQGTTTAMVTYDLGSVLGIDRLALWNEEFSGIGLLDLLTSTDGVTYTALGSFTPTDNPPGVSGDTYGADVFSFAATSARYVRFSMSRCPQPNGNNYTACSIGEVAFRSAVVNSGVPEPATWAMMLLGFGALGFALRRQRGTAAVRVRYA